jgi:hypothetical protein
MDMVSFFNFFDMETFDNFFPQKNSKISQVCNKKLIIFFTEFFFENDKEFWKKKTAHKH